MRASIFSISVIVALSGIPAPGSGAESASAATVTRLCQHVKARKIMYVDRTQPEIIWSDGAMIEVAKTFPRELEALLAAATGGPDLRLILKRMVPEAEKGWQEAKIVGSGRGEEPASVQSKDGKLTLSVASPYFSYLHERHPGARIWVKDRLNAVLFMVDGTLRASVMPMATVASPSSSATK